MGKYTNQAGSYSQGMKMVEITLNNVLEELKTINFPYEEEKMDSLAINTTESIKLINESISGLLETISSNKQKLMKKGMEIDKRLEAEETRRNQNSEIVDDNILKEQDINSNVLPSSRNRVKNIIEDRKLIY